MNVSEVAQVITMIAAYDPYQRKAEDPERARQEMIAQARAWQMAIQHSAPDLTAESAAQAVVRYHAEVSGRPMAVADLIRIGQQIQTAVEARARREELAARHRLPPGERPQPRNVRDRSEDVRALVAGLVEQHGNWDQVGDIRTRQSQAARHPELAAKYHDAKVAKTMAIARERTAARALERAAEVSEEWPPGP